MKKATKSCKHNRKDWPENQQRQNQSDEDQRKIGRTWDVRV